MIVKRLEMKDFDETLLIIVAAFQNSSLYEYVAPDALMRSEFLENIFRFRMKFSVKKGEVYTVMEDERILGIATWIPPYTITTQKDLVDNGGLEVLVGLAPDIRERWTNFTNLLYQAQSKYIQQPFWSLAPIAVLPSRQGAGVASVLIRAQLEKIDMQKLSCFLATQDEGNVAIYSRYGFEVAGEDKILNSGVVNYTMVRCSC